MKMTVKMLCGVAAGLVLVACGGSKEETKADKPAGATEAMVARPADDVMVASCVKMREQMFLCKDQAIDMMMSERAAANPDFAKQMADEAAKATMRTTGLAELEADGGGEAATLDARTEKCKAMLPQMPAQMPQSAMDQFNGLNACWDKPCADRVACVKPFFQSTVKMMAAAPAADAAAAPK